MGRYYPRGYACKEGISARWAGERLQRGYATLRKDPNIISLALTEGYDTEYLRYKDLGAYRGAGTSVVEDAVIQQEHTERTRSGLYRQLGSAAEKAQHRQAALFRQQGEFSGLPRSEWE